MSPRAAWRLERLGFDACDYSAGKDACDYSAGKIDWLAAGLPTIRAEPAPRRALDAADRSPATCSPDTPVARLPTTSVIVVNEGGVVLGRVPPGGRDRVGQSAEAVMEPGPTTVRAREPLDALLDRMTGRNVQEIIVTTPEGRLLGVVHRDEQP